MTVYLSRGEHDPECSVSLPATANELEQVKEALQTDCLGNAVIRDISIEYSWARLLPMDSITLDDANLLAQFVQRMSESELRTFGAALEAEKPATFSDAVCVAENIDDYELVDLTDDAYGRDALRKAGATDEVFELLDGFLDYERLGSAQMEADGVRSTSYGLVLCPSSHHPHQEIGEMQL